MTIIFITAPVRPFKMTYQTDGTEAPITVVNAPSVPVVAAGDNANTGFCLDYQEL